MGAYAIVQDSDCRLKLVAISNCHGRGRSAHNQVKVVCHIAQRGRELADKLGKCRPGVGVLVPAREYSVVPRGRKHDNIMHTIVLVYIYTAYISSLQAAFRGFFILSPDSNCRESSRGWTPG